MGIKPARGEGEIARPKSRSSQKGGRHPRVKEGQGMVRSGWGRGRGGRGRPRQEIPGGRTAYSSGGQRRGRRTTLSIAQEAFCVYQDTTDADIR